MKLYHFLLSTLLVTTSQYSHAKMVEPSELTKCQSNNELQTSEECQLLENAYQRMLELDQVESNQDKYLDGKVQMEMMYGRQIK